jgi:predicted alpha/beta superfamily hydrolase
MKQLLVAVMLFSATHIFAQKTIIDTITSKKLKEQRVITISLPPSYSKEKDKKYPLLLVLDGDYLFEPFQGALAFGEYWEDIPEMIVVGINQSGLREADCTVDKETGLPDAKGSDFFDFIGTELMPALQKTYRIAPMKLVAGHDTTAGFLNFFLYKDQPLFDGYILLSPELSKGMEEQIPDRLSKIEKPIWYYHCTADGDMKKMATRIRKLDEEALKIKKSTVNYRFDDFKGATHYSLVLYAIPNALYQFFAVYQPISTTEFNEKIAVLQEGYVQYLIDKYATIEKSLGMKMQIRLNDFKAIEAAILKNKAYNEFDALSALAYKQYPKSMLADYEMGQMYEKKGDKEKAIKAYMKAYPKEEIGDLTKDMMLEKADALKE